jgi:uncharacterized membrane protein YvbJ
MEKNGMVEDNKTKKWLKWKLIHRETGLKFKQYIKNNKVTTSTGYLIDWSNDKVTPVLLEDGIPAVFNHEPYYPSLTFLCNKDWQVILR